MSLELEKSGIRSAMSAAGYPTSDGGEKWLGGSKYSMEKRVSHAFGFCSFYNRRTRRCTIDGTSWCAFPKSTWCDLSAAEAAKNRKVPTIILQIRRALSRNA